jgi:CubicO group peptidase (beta-lactamase class C family)
VRVGPFPLPRWARLAAAVLGVAVVAAVPALRGAETVPAPAVHHVAAASAPPAPRPSPPLPTPTMPPSAFASVSTLIDGAIAARHLSGAVVAVGHAGEVVFRRSYGSRTAPGQPGSLGVPNTAEPMTDDTVFDMASLTKPLATATAVLQLVERGTVALDEPLQTYLPDYNPGHDPLRARVTVRMLMTHTSGEPGDVNLDDPWGLRAPDHGEGLRRAVTAPLESAPGAGFHYSDINFLLLGNLLERMTGQTEDVYVDRHVFAPLGMTETRYLPAAQACGGRLLRGAAVAGAPAAAGDCPAGSWDVGVLSRIAPTRIDDEGRRDPRDNPDFGYLLRGTVDDPTARRMGGVAGHAGVFSTARDVGLFAQALLDRLAGRPSPFPLRRDTAVLMTTPAQPGHTDAQVEAANRALHAGHRYPAVPGQNLRGLGWDIDTGYSTPRGTVFGVGSFGHTGFTGTSLWIDPASDSYVILLSNAIHTWGSPPVLRLAGAVATAAGEVVTGGVRP